ncbi:MAG: hypothetical protein IID46_16565 [Planctomycetes bacterium]|nr:hypothetical protein [Planctomycetota bacterium]
MMDTARPGRKNPADGSRALKGHTDRIWSVAIRPDGRWLVTGSDDKTARLWDLKGRRGECRSHLHRQIASGAGGR